MNPIPASTSASTSKNAADVEAVSLKFDAQLIVNEAFSTLSEEEIHMPRNEIIYDFNVGLIGSQ